MTESACVKQELDGWPTVNTLAVFDLNGAKYFGLRGYVPLGNTEFLSDFLNRQISEKNDATHHSYMWNGRCLTQSFGHALSKASAEFAPAVDPFLVGYSNACAFSEREPYRFEDYRLKTNLDQPPGKFPVRIISDWDLVADDSTPIEARIESLLRRLSGDTDLVYRTVIYGINELDFSEWRDALVLLSERLEFREESQRRLLVSSLLRVANEHRDSTRVGNRTAVAESALRTAGSMIEVDRVLELLPFTQPGGAVDTRLVSLGVLTNIYSEEILENAPEQIKDRVFSIAQQILQPDTMVPGVVGAIGSKALVALTAMRDKRVYILLNIIKENRLDWVLPVIAHELQRVHRSWSALVVSGNKSHVEFLDSILEVLKSNDTESS